MSKILLSLSTALLLTFVWLASSKASHQRRVIAVDSKTGTPFSIQDQDHEFPMFNDCLGRGTQHVQVIGEVPPHVSLLDDALAQQLIKAANEAVIASCPKFEVEGDSERKAWLEIKLVKEPYLSHMTPTAVLSERRWAPWFGNPRARQVESHYHNYEIERANARKAFAEQELQKKLIQEQNEQRDASIRAVIMAVIMAIFVIFVVGLLINAFSSRRHKSASYGSSSGSAEGRRYTSSDTEKSEWSWRDEQVIIGQKNVYEKHSYGTINVGNVGENLYGEKTINKAGVFSSEKVGTVKTSIFGDSIVDKSGNKVGDIRKTVTGRSVIVDKDGNEIGEYKDD